MRTEYVHGVRSSRTAKNWQKYEQDKDLYPYLEYMPSSSAEPRQSHKRLYGVTKPVDDPFWDTWMPPSDWGCKCGVEQRRRNDRGRDVPEGIPQPPRQFRNNPGKTGKLFTDDHPMIGKLPDTNKSMIERETGHARRKLLRGPITSSMPGKAAGIEISNQSKKKLLNSLPEKEWAILRDLGYFLKNAQKAATRLPNKHKRRSIRYTHFYRLQTENRLYAVVWETKGGQKVMHALVDKISGDKIK